MPGIERISDPSTSWLELLVKFGFQNRPFILCDWSTADWPAIKNWVSHDGKPNIDYLKRSYGNSNVPILVNGSEYRYTNLSEFLETMNDPGVYLKDWHFQNEYGTSMYRLHPFFSRDFVNCESWTTSKNDNPFGDDYRFVYIGGTGSWTRFHSDVVSSHSWSANICGRKEWLMMPPGREQLFKHNFSETGFVDDIRQFPNLFQQAEVITFIQEPGEIVFVPSNWYHQVHNLADTISINHNWINSTNMSLVYELLISREKDVRLELVDCIEMFSKDEFEEKVELILFADARLNKTAFRRLCEFVKTSRSKDIFKYLCQIHKENIWQCISSPSCYHSILSICSCSTSFCSKCSGFIEQLEHSVSSLYL